MLTAMKVARGIILVSVLSAGCIYEDPQVKDRTISNFSLTSKGFKQGDMIPSKYTCDGEDVSTVDSNTQRPIAPAHKA